MELPVQEVGSTFFKNILEDRTSLKRQQACWSPGFSRLRFRLKAGLQRVGSFPAFPLQRRQVVLIPVDDADRRHSRSQALHPFEGRLRVVEGNKLQRAAGSQGFESLVGDAGFVEAQI